jgi:hypothetical protein
MIDPVDVDLLQRIGKALAREYIKRYRDAARKLMPRHPYRGVWLQTAWNLRQLLRIKTPG